MERVERIFVLECPLRVMLGRWKTSVAVKRFVENQGVPDDRLHDSDLDPKTRR
jgi:hypothetical protein